MNWYYQEMLRKISGLGNIRQQFIGELGRVGIYLPIETNLHDVLFCVYFYYMYNLFNNNNTEWRDKYFPLDGTTLMTFIEENLQNKHVKENVYDDSLHKNVLTDMGDVNKKYREIAEEIVSVVYPKIEGQVEEETFERGRLKKFTHSDEYIASGQNTLDHVYDKYVGKGEVVLKVLSSTKSICNILMNIVLWKSCVIEGMIRKKDERRLPVVNLNASLIKILEVLKKEPSYELPDLGLGTGKKILVKNKDLVKINESDYSGIKLKNPYTLFARIEDYRDYYIAEMFEKCSKYIFPSLWQYKPEKVSINNYRSNTIISTYGNINSYYYNDSSYRDSYSYKRDIKSGAIYGNRDRISFVEVPAWASIKDPINMSFSIPIDSTKTLLLRHNDKYNGIFQNKEFQVGIKSYLGFKPKIMLYSKQMDTDAQQGTSSPDSPLDNMNSFKISQTGNLGMTIILPDLVDYNMRYPKRKDGEYYYVKNSDGGRYRNQIDNVLGKVFRIDTEFNVIDKFLLGVYPVDKDDRIMYEDPIAFEYLVRQNLTKDLGLSFTNYVSVNRNNTYNIPFEREFFSLKLGQVFYRNQYTQHQKPKPYTVTKVPTLSISFGDDDTVGNKSKNLLYLYGKDVYMNKIGKISIPSGHNFNITKPDDNTNVTGINLPNTTEYTFKKYGTTKIAIQLYLVKSTNLNFSNFPENEPNSPSEEDRTIYGEFLGLPYGVRTKDGVITKYIVDSDKPYPKTIPMPTPMDDSDCDYYRNGERSYQLKFCTEPVIIDSDDATTDNAPWLDETNAPYVHKVVTQDEGVDIYNYDSNEYVHWDPGIYIKLPDILDRLLIGEDVPKYDIELLNKKDFDRPAGFSIETPYGGTSYDKNIIALVNAIVGIRINYNPTIRNDSENDIINKYKDSDNTKILTSSKDFCIKDMRYVDKDKEDKETDDVNVIKSRKNEFFLWIRKSAIDYEGAGLGRCKDIKIQLIFRNDFFRSNDLDSPLNYNYVPIKGHVKLLREIAGQRIKLYRGGRLVHPTDYVTKGDRQNLNFDLNRNHANEYFERIKEVILNREITDGYYSDCLINTEQSNRDTLVDKDGVLNSDVFNVKDSVFDIISIEMDRPHWQQLLTDYNTNAINSLETDTNNNMISFPINIEDNEDLNLFEFDIEENSTILDDNVKNRWYNRTSINETYSDKFKPKINLDGTLDSNKSYKYLLFWYFFRPKVKFAPDTNGGADDLVMQVESFEDWKDRITRENKAYFNRKKVKFEKVKLSDNMSYLHPYKGGYDSQDDIIELKDIFNIQFNIRTYREISSQHSVTEDFVDRNDCKSLYNYFANMIVDLNGHSGYFNDKLNIKSGKRKKTMFGGWMLERMLNHEWIFSFNYGFNREFDERLRIAANDIALSIFKQFNSTMFSLVSNFIYSGGVNNWNNTYVRAEDYINGIWSKIKYFMHFNPSSVNEDLKIGYGSGVRKFQPSKNRLVRFTTFVSKDVLGVNGNNNELIYYYLYDKEIRFNDSDKRQTKPIPYNISKVRFYKGDNKLQITKDKRFIKRGFRMGKKTPDNPFMGFSIPATMYPNIAPDYVHIVYCDIKWSDFDKTLNRTTSSWNSVSGAEIISESGLSNQYRCSVINSKYDFTGFEDKYHFEEWADQGKHIIVRLFTDVPTNEEHRDCPINVTGTAYENSLGKGFKPDMSNAYNRMQYILAFTALSKWLRDKYGNSNVIDYIWVFEIGLGHNNYGYNIINGKKIYDSNLKEIYRYLNENMPDKATTFGNTNGYRKFNILTSYNIKLPNRSDNKFNKLPMIPNLGNKEDVDMWVKYNYVGTTNENSYDSFIENFDLRNSFKAGVIRNDISMEELMKPDNYRDLLYSFKSINPMFVIGYIDKEKYPEQYEELMNEMGYKLTVTSVEVEPGKVTLNYSNEGHNNIYDIPNIKVNLDISVKGINNSGIDTNIAAFDFLQTYDVQRNTDKLAMTKNTNKLVSQNFNTKGDVKLFDATYKSGTFTVQNITYTNPKLSSICGKTKPVNMFASFKIFLISTAAIGLPLSINLANVNRKTEINLTDSSFLKNFIVNDEDANWYSENIENNYKMDENGWI